MKCLISERIRDIEPAGLGLAPRARIKSPREDCGIAELTCHSLRLSEDRSALARPAEQLQASGPGAESADARRLMGFGTPQVHRLLSPVHDVRVATSHQPVVAERRAHRERLFGAGLADRPFKGRMEVVDLGVKQLEVLLAAEAPQRLFRSLA